MFISFFNVWYVTTNIENYIKIQKVRYGNKIEYEIDIENISLMSNTGAVSDIAILFITTFVIKNNYG